MSISIGCLQRMVDGATNDGGEFTPTVCVRHLMN